jgi:hypothetical protein
MAAAAGSKGRAIAGSFVSRVLAGKAASPRYSDGPHSPTRAGFGLPCDSVFLLFLSVLVLDQFVQDLAVVLGL